MRPRKHASREVLLIKKLAFIKKSFTWKEKTGTVIKVKFVTKIKKHNQLYLELRYCYCGDNA